MPKLRQPGPLGTIALRATAAWLCKLAKEYMPVIAQISKVNVQEAAMILKDKMQELHDLFEYNVPFCLYDKLAEEMFIAIPRLIENIKSRQELNSSMGKFLSEVNVAVSLTEVLLSSNLRTLHFDQVPKMMRHIFYMKLDQLTGIMSLDLGSLSGGWKTQDMEPTVLNGIVNMRNLRAISINYDATDNIITTLGECCPNVVAIDFSSSKCITNASIDLLMALPNLRRVILYRTSVTMDGYIRLLLNLPKIEDLGRYDDLGRCLSYIDTYYPNLDELNLTKFISHYATTEHLQILGKLCPKLHTVSLFHNALLVDLMTLIAIDDLRDLKLLSADFFADQIRHVLEVKGCNLTHLHLEHVDEIDMNALIYISQFCPDLKTFVIYNCDLVDSTSLCMRRFPIPPFMNLEKLTIAATCKFWHLDFLLATAFKIRYIHFGTMVPTDDDLIVHVLAKNPMPLLEEFRIMFSECLTINSAYKLANTCVSLQKLTEIESWTKITEAELNIFRKFIKARNMDLDIKSQKFNSN
uniref:Scf e3 ubiquitin ligase complex f-box protein grra n=1 Tax=Lutzomyia longipalpis TaxID=7200 RepID=A0A1B0CDD9_LUTLO